MKNKTTITLLASMMSIRMLGLFMILPIFAVAAENLIGATPKLMGIAIGIYGLTQACFQMPMGFLSDYLGRKRVIFAGLCLFLIGSILGANAHTIDMMIFARALQGSGAIGSTILAFVADITPVESRTKAMAFIGMSVAFAFTGAMIAGPIIHHYFNLSGIFWATAGLACIAILFLAKIPAEKKEHRHYFEKKNFRHLLFDTKLLSLDFSIFSLHAILTAMFVALPILFTHKLELSSFHQIILYSVILVVGFIFAVPLIITAEKRGKIRTIFVSAIATIAFIEVLFCFVIAHLSLLRDLSYELLFLFFVAFTALEALLPSMVSKTVLPQKKGAAMGIYSTCQFLGIFVGGSLGGVMLAHCGIEGVFALCSVISLGWLLLESCKKN